MEFLGCCPVCSNKLFKPFLSCIDYTVSRETFEIVQCNNCAFKFTNPRPDKYQIAKYYESAEYVSHSNTDKGLINKIYKIVRGLALNTKLELIHSLGKGNRKILDIGCGTGDFLKKCKTGGWETLGVEPNEKARNYAIVTNGQKVYEESFIETDSSEYNVISMWHVLEHVHNLNERIDQLLKLLEHNGTLIVAVPNCDSYDAGKYGNHWAAYDLPRHLYHFTPDSMKILMHKHGFKIEKMLPMPFDAFYVSMLSEKYKGNSLNLLAALLSGIKSNWIANANVRKCSSIIYLLKRL